jgi:uncharacterized protein (TIGR04222 family)
MGYVLLVVAILIAGFVALAGWAKPTDAVEHEAIGAESSGRGDLDVYELAYLAEGPHRVVNTAIVVLMNRELIRISRGGRIHRVSGSARASADAVEQAVLVSASRPGGVTAAHLRAREIEREHEPEQEQASTGSAAGGGGGEATSGCGGCGGGCGGCGG